MRNQEEIKIELQKKIRYIDEFVWGTSFFRLHSPLSVSFVVTFFIFCLSLLEWRISWMGHIKMCNIAMGGILCDDIMRERSKYENLLKLDTRWLASLITWYYFRLCFSFICPDYDLILIQESHPLNCYRFLQNFLLKTKIYKLVAGNCDSSIYC